MNTNRRTQRTILDDTLSALTGLAVGVLVALITLSGAFTGKADAVQPQHGAGGQTWTLTPWVQPYGGCKEAIDFPRTEGAQECRDHGWTVTRHIVVGPNHWVQSFRDLPACAVEDGSYGILPCRWNFGPGVQGNGIGRAYWINWSHHTKYVKGWYRQ